MVTNLPNSVSHPNHMEGGGGSVLEIEANPTLKAFISSAALDPNISPDIRLLALEISSNSSVPYKTLKSLWLSFSPSARPRLSSLLTGSDFIFRSPKPRIKSQELKVRLRKLADLAERKEYDELVKDITPTKSVNEPFSSYKDQLGFGVHVVLIMFTGYLVGYTAFRALFGQSPVMNAAGGLTGLVGGMLLETLLFIIRTSNYDRLSSSSTSKLKNQ